MYSSIFYNFNVNTVNRKRSCRWDQQYFFQVDTIYIYIYGGVKQYEKRKIPIKK